MYVCVYVCIEQKTIRGDCSQKHKDQDKENLKCAILKTKSKLVKFPFLLKKQCVITSGKVSQNYFEYLIPS